MHLDGVLVLRALPAPHSLERAQPTHELCNVAVVTEEVGGQAHVLLLLRCCIDAEHRWGMLIFKSAPMFPAA